jgi:undecaprenyl-diphosphatase
VIHLVLVHIGKKWIFHGMPRPVEFFKDVPFYEVPGIQLHHWGSFPSGHTLHAVVFSLVALNYYPQLSLILLPFTLMVALSRVVLGLHYPSDVVAGALIGAAVASLSFSLVALF